MFTDVPDITPEQWDAFHAKRVKALTNKFGDGLKNFYRSAPVVVVKQKLLPTPGKTIGSRILALRARMNLSQPKLAERLDTTRVTVSRWERGHCVPHRSMIEKISKFFGVSSAYFLCEGKAAA